LGAVKEAVPFFLPPWSAAPWRRFSTTSNHSTTAKKDRTLAARFKWTAAPSDDY